MTAVFIWLTFNALIIVAALTTAAVQDFRFHRALHTAGLSVTFPAVVSA